MTCFQMYSKKELLDHQPMGLTVFTGHSLRYIAIAAPDLIEWVPIWCLAIPSQVSPMAPTTSGSALIT